MTQPIPRPQHRLHPSPLAPLILCCDFYLKTIERCMHSWSFYHIFYSSFAPDGIANRERLKKQPSQLSSTSFSFSSRGRLVCIHACVRTGYENGRGFCRASLHMDAVSGSQCEEVSRLGLPAIETCRRSFS
jgi:hypothetical protein